MTRRVLRAPMFSTRVFGPHVRSSPDAISAARILLTRDSHGDLEVLRSRSNASNCAFTESGSGLHAPGSKRARSCWRSCHCVCSRLCVPWARLSGGCASFSEQDALLGSRRYGIVPAHECPVAELGRQWFRRDRDCQRGRTRRRVGQARTPPPTTCSRPPLRLSLLRISLETQPPSNQSCSRR